MKCGIARLLFLVSSGLFVTAGMEATSLTFTGLSTSELVLNYYNGGFGSFGSGPGPAYGITFDSNFQVLSTGVYGPPVDRAVSALASGATFNDLPGFSGDFSFYYKD